MDFTTVCVITLYNLWYVALWHLVVSHWFMDIDSKSYRFVGPLVSPENYGRRKQHARWRENAHPCPLIRYYDWKDYLITFTTCLLKNSTRSTCTPWWYNDSNVSPFFNSNIGGNFLLILSCVLINLTGIGILSI